MKEAHKGYSQIQQEFISRTRDLPEEILEENLRQLDKWGLQCHPPDYWMGILMEEVGEAAKACIERDRINLREELVQVAAVAHAFIDYLDRSFIPDFDSGIQ